MVENLFKRFLIAVVLILPSSHLFAQSSLLPDDERVVMAIRKLNADGGENLALLENLAEKGNAKAMLAIGNLYEQGRVFQNKIYKIDEEKAYQLYAKSAKKGNAIAQYKMARMFLSEGGYKYCCKNAIEAQKQAILYFHSAASKPKSVVNEDDPVSNSYVHIQSTLGDMYVDGIGVEKDAKKAAGYYRAAIEGNTNPKINQPFIYSNLAGYYLSGEGVEKNEKEAVRLFLECAEMKDAQCLYMAGVIYKNGYGGVEVNMKKAKENLTQAKSKGHPKAEAILSLLGALGE